MIKQLQINVIRYIYVNTKCVVRIETVNSMNDIYNIIYSKLLNTKFIIKN